MAEPQGLYRKFNVSRVDPEAQERHKDCAVFVLEPKHDYHARMALREYERSVRPFYPELANDIHHLLHAVEEED